MSSVTRHHQATDGLKIHERGTTVKFGEITYYLDDAAAEVISFQPSRPSDGFFSSRHGDVSPCTVINWSKDHFSQDDLNAITSKLALQDDVWTPSFLEVIILQTRQSTKVSVVQDRISLLLMSQLSYSPTGPYAFQPSTGEIFRVSRIHEDDCSAFIGGSIRFSAQLNAFRWLNSGNCIAISSGFGLQPTSTHPLEGLRFAAKDNIDVAGLKTGLGNRSYRKHLPDRPRSARCIERLMEAGAILVGKTKTTQFAEGEVPTQWTDYLAPFNPRGDSYQSPSSSSAGSAAASAAYPWLDFNIGTDTGGSTRHPAGVCGIYGMRTSTNKVSMAGIYSVSPLLDSVGVFARSARILEHVIKVLIEHLSSPLASTQLSPPRYKLLYPIRAKGTKPEDSYRWFPCPGEPGCAANAEDVFEKVIKEMESYLYCTRSAFNLDDLWLRTRPTGQDESLDKATGGIYTVLTTHSCVRNTIDPFIDDFKAANNGRAPFIDSIVKARQDHGRSTTTAQHDSAVQSAQVFSKWVRETLFAKSTDDNEFPLLVFPQSWGLPAYRDDADTGLLFFSSFSIYSLSYLSGCPDCTVPVGEVPCQSRVTGTEMFLPVSLSVLSPPGTDVQLASLLAELEENRVLRAVEAGARMYKETG